MASAPTTSKRMQEGVRLDAGIDSSFQIDITMLCIDEASTAPSAAASPFVPPTRNGFGQASV